MEIKQTSSDDDAHGESNGDSPPILDYRNARYDRANSRRRVSSKSGALLAGVTVGCLFGIPFMLIPILASVSGNGAYFIFLLASSPLTITNNLEVVWFGIPIIWAIAAGLATTAANRAGAVVFIFAMSCHYLLILCSIHRLMGEFGRAGHDIQWFGLGFYAIGQITLWTIFVLARRHGIAKRRQEALNRTPAPVYYTSAARRAAADDQQHIED